MLEVMLMNHFTSKKEEFNYYVLKSEWYRKRGDIVNCILCYQKAKAIKQKLDEENNGK